MIISRKKILYLSAGLVIGLAFVFLAPGSWALDAGTDVVNNSVKLGSESPIKVVARIINFVMIFLGIIAVCLMIFAGFKWMTSNGNEEQVAEAKRTLKMAVIGLLIILSSWGITAFVLNRLVGASTGSDNNPSGECTGPGCDLPPCIGAGCEGASCDSNSLMNGCQAGACQTGLTCSPSSCTCVSGNGSSGGQGEACSSSADKCSADDGLCDSDKGLKCNTDSCICEGRPVITDISPTGGFCVNDHNTPCNSDEHCLAFGGGCDLVTPNGRSGSIVAIRGYNFGSNIDDLKVYFAGDTASPAQLAADLYSNCPREIKDDEVLVVVPSNNIEGPISLEVTGGGLDTTNDDTGPKINDFVSTIFSRPGLCSVNPESATTGDSLQYDGSDFQSDNSTITRAYFGNYLQNYKAVSSDFYDQNSGQATVPNINSGQTGTFVGWEADNGAMLYSNALKFSKTEAPAAEISPVFSSFEPVSGPVGQYVTINGSGFGNTKGNNKVMFADSEADYNFPQICLQSLWRDDRIVVKVPQGLDNGLYALKLNIDGKDIVISSGAGSFNIDSSLPLKPSICRLDPEFGPVSTQVRVWGEYFKNNTKMARFYNNKDSQATSAGTENGADSIITTVASGAISGPMSVIRDGLVSNSLNFGVGECRGDESCNGAFCCPFGSPKKGQCAANLLGCYYSVGASVYEWSFATNIGTSCDGDSATAKCDYNNQLCPVGTSCDQNSCICKSCSGSGCVGGVGSPCSDSAGVCQANNNKCNQGLTCNPSSCTCQSGSTSYSCAYLASVNQVCPTGFCPNSPGICSADSTIIKKTQGNCDYSCNSVSGCAGDKCTFEKSSQTCISNDLRDCSTDYKMKLGSSDVAVSCRLQPAYGNKWHFEIATTQNCPTGWFRVAGGKCLDSLSTTESTCNVCNAGFTCKQDKEATLGQGLCLAGSSQCASDYPCDPVTNKCTQSAEANCACCCEIDQSDTQCCAPTKCQGTCGYDNTDDGAGLGYCGGCYNSSNTPEENDQACNCSNASGKFCLQNSQYTNGACVDCTQLPDADSCSAHAGACCWDGQDGVCRGGDGLALPKAQVKRDVPEEDFQSKLDDIINSGEIKNYTGYGQCAYYGCDGSGCDVNTPGAYDNINYPYRDTGTCQATCASGGGSSDDPTEDCSKYNSLDVASKKTGCLADTNCCYDSYTSLCKGGSRLTSADTVASSLWGYCAYYKCNSSTYTCGSSFNYGSAVGPYGSLAACQADCKMTVPSGSVCSDGVACQPSYCSAPFACLNSSGTSNTSSCGTCCCNPNASTDSCALTDSNLHCEADRGSCSGGSRGLCCGCENDGQCGNDTLFGCSYTSCCESRPKVLASSTSPLIGQQNVCRNAVVYIPFDQKLDLTTVSGNVVLLAEKNSNENCPSGSATLVKANNSWWQRVTNFFSRTYYSVARLFNRNISIAVSPDVSQYKYCFVSGAAVAEESDNNTSIRFYPEKILDPSTNYFVVIKGQENLASSSNGIISAKGIGFYDTEGYKGSFGPWNSAGTQYYYGSMIYRFSTMAANNQTSGLCLVDHVELSPKSYLFSTATDDPLEDDSDASSATFDTSADSDKTYIANAVAANGQILNSLPGTYFWDFSWLIQNNQVVDFQNVSGLPSNGNKRLVAVTPGTTDGSTEINVQANIGGIFGASTKSRTEKAQVFICSNPWPAKVVDSNGYLFWQPFIDQSGNCLDGSTTCNTYNYSFYYCRDSGDAGTADDLPSLSGKGEVNRGQSDKKVCSNDRSKYCLADADCANGLCIYEMLKESYFFSN